MTEDGARRARAGQALPLHSALVARLLEGGGRASRSQRRAAFDNRALDEPLRTLIDKVAESPTRVTDEDIASVKTAGWSEDQVFELIVCAAVGQSTRQYEAGLAAMDEALAAQNHAPRDS